jgi:hypothetical protein
VKGGERLRSHMFAELQSHYLFDDRFGRPGKGNDTDEIEQSFLLRGAILPSPTDDRAAQSRA